VPPQDLNGVGRLGLIAGGGRLPTVIAESCRARGREPFVIRLPGAADPALAAFEGADVGLAELGTSLKALRRAGCRSVCLAGNVRRPDFSALKPDLAALKHLPRLIAAAGKGDDALLRAVLAMFEAEGFEVEGAGAAAPDLLLGPGPLGSLAPGPDAADDAAAAIAAARRLGLTDAGQAAVVRAGRLLAVEDAHGTDAMLARCDGGAGGRDGVLAKVPKPGQDRRVDLPTIGVATVEGAAAAGLAGIVGEAGQLLVVDKAAVRAAADRLGLFVVGVEA
jgi:DUF1009 family protein